jgi:hypothetical protein
MTHLTPAQERAIISLASWRRGYYVPTASLRSDGISLSTLRTLEAIDLVESERHTNGIYWKATEAGHREAERRTKP